MDIGSANRCGFDFDQDLVFVDLRNRDELEAGARLPGFLISAFIFPSKMNRPLCKIALQKDCSTIISLGKHQCPSGENR